MQCCRHGNILLDADQEVPPHEDIVYYKWRFYHREWRPSDTEVVSLVWYLSHSKRSIEYDAVIAPPGTAPADTVHRVTSNFSMADVLTRSHQDPAKVKIGVKLYNADTGELVCHVLPAYGNGTAAMNEKSYMYLPPCMWGSVEEGLRPPPVFPVDTNFSAVKTVNNTYYHYGGESQGAISLLVAYGSLCSALTDLFVLSLSVVRSVAVMAIFQMHAVVA
jgi:hypothetical protein